MSTRNASLAETHQPALIVTHGNTVNKHRVMKGETMILGRARGCDVRLEAPDISDVHCVLTRQPAGLHIRDCGSRTGIRVNGDPVQTAILHDGDILLVGLFSFRVSVPDGALPASTPVNYLTEEAGMLLRLRRSRLRIAQLALRLRRRLRQERAGRLSAGERRLAERQAELDQAAESLRGQLGACNQRIRQLDEAERDLSRDRDALDQQRTAVEEARRQLAEPQAEMDELRAHRQEWQEHRVRLERELAEAREGLAVAKRQQAASQAILAAKLQELELENQSWKERSRYLVGTRLPLGQEEGLAAPPANAVGLTNSAAPAQQVLEADAVRVELQRELDTLREENARLHLEVAEHEVSPTEKLPWVAEADQLSRQVTVLTEQLRQKEALLEDLAQEREAVERADRSVSRADIDKYEAELNEFRRQLEADRQALDEEMHQLQERKAELEETVRNEELQVSRERAQLARERVQLDQMRDMLRFDLERAERDGEIRKRLAGLQRRRQG